MIFTTKVFFLILFLFSYLFNFNNCKIVVVKNDYSCNQCFKKIDEFFHLNKIKYYYNSKMCEKYAFFRENSIFLKSNMPHGKEIKLEKIIKTDSINCFIPSPFILLIKKNTIKLIHYKEIFDNNLKVNENIKSNLRF